MTEAAIPITVTRSEDSGGQAITGHELFIDDGSQLGTAAWAQVAGFTGASLGYSISATTESLTAGKIYRIKVRAVNPRGASAFTGTTAVALARLPG